MKTIITKFWGLALIVILLTSLFVVTAAPVSAGNWALGESFALPETLILGTTVIAPAATFGIVDVAQSGSTIYATATDGAALDYLYKSTNGGATWARVLSANVAPPFGIAAGTWNIVAVAPDDPNVIVVVDTAPVGADVVYLSTSGGAVWSALTAIAADLNAVAISPTNGFARYIAIGGSTAAAAVADNSSAAFLRSWTIGSVAPAWAAPNGFTPTIAPTSVPAAATGNLSLDDVQELAFSPNFLADQALFVITESVGSNGGRTGEVALHVTSYNTFNWDAAIDVSFPRVLEVGLATTAFTCLRAEIALDANFFLADEATQIGFIGADITGPVAGVAVQVGGVYRVGTYTVAAAVETMTQIMTGTAVRSVAWDGTNLIAAQNAVGGNVWRSSTALGVVPAFLQNSTLKAATTGTIAEVIFNGTTGYAFANGASAGIAKSGDLGKSWNGFALMASDSFEMVYDAWVSPDGAVRYYVADDGVDVAVWRTSGFATERVMLLVGGTGIAWLVRADADNPATVYIGRAAGTNMYKSTDSGETLWTARAASMAIADFAVQDANTVYVGSGTFVAKSTNGAFTWGFPTAIPFVTGGGNVYSLNLISNDNMLVGGTAGGAAYTTDGGTVYTGIGGLFNMFGANAVLTADSLAAGGNIYGVVTTGVNRWTIGASFGWTAGKAMGGGNGVALSNGVLYVLDDVGGNTTRFQQPAIDISAVTGTDAAEAGAYTRGVNKLQASAAGTTSTIWAVNNAAGALLDSMHSYTDALTSQSNAPALVYPINNAKIDINSISGLVAAFMFQWNAPTVFTFPATAYRYDLQVFLDEAGTVPVTNLATTLTTSFAPSLSMASGAFGVPGETYYWHVRVSFTSAAAGAAGVAMNSYFSPMGVFTVQQLTAIVPVIASPPNGTVVAAGLTPAFSWSPISGATSYKFELDTGTTFVAPLYTTTSPSAGASLPITIKLQSGKTYFWRVKALAPTEGEWSTVGNFMVAEPVVVVPPVTVTDVPAPVITVNIPAAPPATTITIPPAPVPDEVNPTYIWAIIIIGAVLVIAVIVLIVRTRRSV